LRPHRTTRKPHGNLSVDEDEQAQPAIFQLLDVHVTLDPINKKINKKR
jgi:hypothetical protein